MWRPFHLTAIQEADHYQGISQELALGNWPHPCDVRHDSARLGTDDDSREPPRARSGICETMGGATSLSTFCSSWRLLAGASPAAGAPPGRVRGNMVNLSLAHTAGGSARHRLWEAATGPGHQQRREVWTASLRQGWPSINNLELTSERGQAAQRRSCGTTTVTVAIALSIEALVQVTLIE